MGALRVRCSAKLRQVVELEAVALGGAFPAGLDLGATEVVKIGARLPLGVAGGPGTRRPHLAAFTGKSMQAAQQRCKRRSKGSEHGDLVQSSLPFPGFPPNCQGWDALGRCDVPSM